MRVRFLWVVWCLVGALAQTSEARMRVVVSIPPQQGLIARMAGDRVDVETLVGPGDNPHTYEPTYRQRVRIAESQLLFTIGLPFEAALVPRLQRAHPGLQIVNSIEGYPPSAPSDGGSTDASHRHGAPCDAHPGDDSDPHGWISPRGMVHQVRRMAEHLALADPDHAGLYRERAEQLTAEIEALDAELGMRLAPHAGQTFLVYHPAWGHFARAYGLGQMAIERHGGAPGARHLVELTDAARQAGTRGILVQSEAEARRSRPLAETLDLRILLVNPLEADPVRLLETTAEAVLAALPPPLDPIITPFP